MVTTAAARMEPAGLQHRAHHPAGGPQGPVALPADRRRSRIRVNEPHEHPQSRCLPGPVRTQEPGDLPGPGGEAEVIHRRDTTKPLGQARSPDVARLIPHHAASLALSTTLPIPARGSTNYLVLSK